MKKSKVNARKKQEQREARALKAILKKLNYKVKDHVIGVKIDEDNSLLYSPGIVLELDGSSVKVQTIEGKEKDFAHSQVFSMADMDDAIAYHGKLHHQFSRNR